MADVLSAMGRAVTLPLHLAVRNLLQDRVRLVLSILGIALAIMLILFLLGLRTGFIAGAGVYLDNSPGSVVVLPEGVRNTASASSQFLPQSTADRLAEVPGVERLTPVLRMDTAIELGGKTELIRVAGYAPPLGGGPWSLAEGREPAGDNEIVLDRVLGKRHGFDVGDIFEMGGRELSVVGLSNDTISFTGAYVFATKPLVEALLLTPGGASIIFVTPQPGVDAAELASQLRAVPGTNVLLKREVIANNEQIIAGVVDQIVMLMVGAAFVVGALVVGMVIYTATMERRSEYGVLKAIGARTGTLYRVVVSQALAAAALGTGVGVILAFFAGGFVNWLRPEYMVTIEPRTIAGALAAGFVMALLGGLVPARAIANLPPAEVFRR